MKPATNAGVAPAGATRWTRGLAIALCLAPIAVGAAQQQPRRPITAFEVDPPDSTTRAQARTRPEAAHLPMLLSFSGGISLGAYQAGVSWAIIEFAKRTHDPLNRRIWNVPQLDVPAMSGASAGNINVLLGAVQYCDLVQHPESESLLWKMWVNTGWNELAPARIRRDPTSNDHGILDRGSIRDRVLPALERGMTQSAYEPRCSVSLGVVTTRLAPGVLSHDDNIAVRNQRFVSLFRMREANGRLQLVRPDTALLADPRLGQQLVLPTERAVGPNVSSSGATAVIAPSRVFAVIMASAAYPVAFAPMLIEYQEPSCVLSYPNPPGCTEKRNEMFLDGGVFDNNPVSLALGIERKVTPADARPRIVFVDPDALRGRLRQQVAAREPARLELRDRGIGALFHFGSGFIRTARQYELQSFIRQNLAESESGRAFILSSTRAHPVVGEYFNAFAAFFGRPFREFDFYDGVADGLRFVSYEILCDPSRLPTRVAADGGDGDETAAGSSDARDACAAARLVELARQPFGLSAVGREVVRDVLVREDATFADSIQPMPLSGADVDRYAAISAVERATAAQLADERPFVCESGDLPALLLCYDGFDRVLDSLRRDAQFVALVERWADSEECRRPADKYDPASCRAEHILHDFVRDPHGAMQGLVDQLLTRMRASEEELGNEHAPNQKRLVKTIELLYRSTNQQARRGLDLDPSSIPPRDQWYWQSLHLLPFYVGGTVGNAGTQVGWQPTWHRGLWHIAAATPFELSRLPRGYARDGAFSWYASLSPSIGRDFGAGWLNQVFIGGRSEFDLGTRHAVPWFRQRSTLLPEASVLAVANKLRLSVYRVPPHMAFNHRPLLRGTIAFADVNGVLYWLLR